jgi:wyosine [tRNA(Phe)-imidazoG37] synthetase (radical SAM superfamily)
MSSIVFGPILSRRFGKSLGIDLSPYTKICNYDCLYCELSPARPTTEPQEVPEVEEIVSEVREALHRYDDIDILTITANGEPTLYPKLAKLIKRLKEISGGRKILILSNGSTVHDRETREALKMLDIVKLSLDCATPRCLRRIDRMHKSIDPERIKEGMLKFAGEYEGSLIIEILVVAGINDRESEMRALSDFLVKLAPERIDIGTIDRPPAYDVKAVDYGRLRELSMYFDPSLHIAITSREGATDTKASSYTREEIISTLSRRPLTPHDVEILFDRESAKRLDSLVKEGKVAKVEKNGVIFFENCTKTLDK